MKKIGIFMVIFIVALGALGVGYAQWMQTLNINTTITTGTVSAQFDSTVSNDPGTTLDPSAPGTWTYPAMTWAGSQYTIDVAQTTAVINAGDSTILDITATNAYPSYNPGVAFSIVNTGTIPIKYGSTQLVSVNGVTLGTPYTVTSGVPVYIDATGNPTATSTPATDLFSFIVTPNAPATVVPNLGLLYGDVSFHVEDGAAMAATTYSFSLAYNVTQFNAP